MKLNIQKSLSIALLPSLIGFIECFILNASCSDGRLVTTTAADRKVMSYNGSNGRKRQRRDVWTGTSDDDENDDGNATRWLHSRPTF
ncbi:hypothetical protein G7Y89_g13318 [Cudoniella acicularis]|uniref:Secreted protein n=1 Tax=Cudoniella acicularis TaxID=354080 RepID=A0A8H4VW67_9HELO|nr:hypothetical protein G7Y89_g13318 [Cudoniella acicularis]